MSNLHYVVLFDGTLAPLSSNFLNSKWYSRSPFLLQRHFLLPLSVGSVTKRRYSIAELPIYHSWPLLWVWIFQWRLHSQRRSLLICLLVIWAFSAIWINTFRGQYKKVPPTVFQVRRIRLQARLPSPRSGPWRAGSCPRTSGLAMAPRPRPANTLACTTRERWPRQGNSSTSASRENPSSSSLARARWSRGGTSVSRAWRSEARESSPSQQTWGMERKEPVKVWSQMQLLVKISKNVSVFWLVNNWVIHSAGWVTRSMLSLDLHSVWIKA